VPVRQAIGAFEGEPGLAPDLRLLHLHPTLLNPRWPKDSMRTLTLTLGWMWSVFVATLLVRCTFRATARGSAR